MPLELDPAPIPGTVQQSIAHNEQQFRKTQAVVSEIEAVRDGVLLAMQLSGIGNVWQWDDTLAGAVAAGFVGADNAALNLATQLRIAEADAAARQLVALSNVMSQNDHLLVTNVQQGAANLYQINGAITDNGTWLTVPVVHVAGAGGNFIASELITIETLWADAIREASIRFENMR